MSSKSIRYCDRCGREIPSDVRPRRLFRSRTFVKANLAYILSGDEDYLEISDSEDDSSLDLCKECSESFVKWFNDGKRGEMK